MSDYEKYITEFESITTSVLDEAVIELSKTFDQLFYDEKVTLIPATIDRAVAMLDNDYNIPTKMQINYDISNAHHDLRVLTQEYNHEKEILYLRKTLDMYEHNYPDDQDLNDPSTKVARYIALRSYTNLGNSMYAVGRYIAAIDYFNEALLIENTFAMASLNLSITLFKYAQLQIKPYEQNYFHHACYYFYQQTQENKVNLEDQEYLTLLEEKIASFHPEYIEGFLKKSLKLPIFGVDSHEEADYRNYMLLFRLFLEPCLDILNDHCFAVDSINLPLEIESNPKNREYIGLFNQIKQEFNLSRYLWYKTTALSKQLYHFSERELDFTDISDNADYSLKEGLLRTAFKSAYSTFDRIGFFINQYFNVGLMGRKISFKNVWKSESMLKACNDNPLIMAMYWLQKDFFEDESTNITSPLAEPMFQMRNDMEHNCLRTGQKQDDAVFTKYTYKYCIDENTCRLLKLLRENIIYLCLAINYDNKKHDIE